MEEADTLCTRISIMKRGRMRATGTQLHLKNRFGSGYKLSINVPDTKVSVLSLSLEAGRQLMDFHLLFANSLSRPMRSSKGRCVPKPRCHRTV
jgi:ABC-type multidrug transport system ATPase subunit